MKLVKELIKDSKVGIVVEDSWELRVLGKVEDVHHEYGSGRKSGGVVFN